MDEGSSIGIDVIKEENKRKQMKTKGGKQIIYRSNCITIAKRNRAVSNGACSGQQKNTNYNAPQNNFSLTQMQPTNYSGMVANRVLNLPPKPSRNTKNNTLVLGNSSSVGLHTRSVQNFLFNKKNPPISSMANAASLVVPASAKKEPSAPTTIFKSSSKK